MQNLSRRYLFLYFLITTAVWNFLYDIPGLTLIPELYNRLETPVVTFLNSRLFHISDALNQNGGGSGDTSYAWAQFFSIILLALTGSLLWSLLARKRPSSGNRLAFLTRNLVRYSVVAWSLSYGIIKLFAQQMPFPSLSQLATPLGDLLPMRLSWMFFGYSTPYQVFSGALECIAALLLFYRGTATLGALLATGVFANVFALNLCYDIPVKLFSMQLLLCSIYLVWGDRRRLLDFFIRRQATAPSSLYDLELEKPWQRYFRWFAKTGFILYFVGIPVYIAWSEEPAPVAAGPIPTGIYDVVAYVQNGDTPTLSVNDEWSWKDIIFDKNGQGSINTTDTLFRQRYRRGYFAYDTDTTSQLIHFKKTAADTSDLFSLHYTIPDDGTILLSGLIRNDSAEIRLQRMERQFQLTEKQFHWISEANR